MSNVILGAHLPIGRSTVGKKYPLTSPEQQSEFAHLLSEYRRPLTVINTADCMEDREIIGFADGTDDPNTLAERVTHQGPGGLGLMVTKAAIGADLPIIRDAKTIQEAYETLMGFLQENGYEDAGHERCGASASVEKSVALELPNDEVMTGLPALTKVDARTAYYIQRNAETKRRKLAEGFYGTWDPAWHESYVSGKFPHNFARLAIDMSDPETHGGHFGSGVFVVSTPGYGFAKTAFAQETRRYAFGLTTPQQPEFLGSIIKLISGSPEAEARFTLELGIDAEYVTSGIVVPGFPAFVEAA